MQIILLEDVKKQGKKGEVISVKDGYGAFLIKNKQAVMATSGSVTRLNKENSEKQLEENLLIKEMKDLKLKLEKNIIVFKVKTGEQDRVFGSVTTKQIANSLKIEGHEIDKKKIKIDHDLSTLGIHNVEIELHKKVIATIKVELKKES